MAKAVYVGVGSKARKMKKAYIGIGGKARKVKKMSTLLVARLLPAPGSVVWAAKVRPLTELAVPPAEPEPA